MTELVVDTYFDDDVSHLVYDFISMYVFLIQMNLKYEIKMSNS